MFNKTLIAAAIMFSGAAMAAESTGVAGGTITFNGSVSDTTCDVTTNNGSDFTVNLSPITLTDMGKTAGIVTANEKDFTMSLKNCTAADEGTKTLKITFTSSNLSDDGKYLKNYSEGGAEGVGITLTSDGKTAVPFDTAFNTGLTSDDVSSTDGITLTMHANYYNFGGASVTTGKVVTDATYSFSYD
ncbi:MULTISPECIES: fimbrial protein [Enterobacter]|jgi:major type 1 subunit fimbrin (pilin)|uniref:Fimbrial protein n=1 Tax=Enterobacter ludwigii TaxID=299767 RepID=G8LP57_9ENTR|nr:MULTISPECIES: fimbrial protein [Enterobacter]GJK53797.1 fimbrial protein [Enterobacter cloacae]AEW72317.1 Fimbrial subunit type 3 [Enterobacter ludwigii]AKM86268.1 fimbrial protein [Enterobacter ludwigii]EKS6737867.1 type 1 fimbrial protein [Enterobacter ludwigii]EKS7106455.1 type 1 fimbrial protein [Enterobacter ludwigii]